MSRDEWEIPFQSNKPDVWYNYRCTKCKTLDKVPGFVVDEFSMGREDLEPGEAPEIVCPQCGKAMKMEKPNKEAT